MPIHIQLPQNDPSSPIKVIERMLSEEKHFEEVAGMKSFRVELLEKVLKNVKQAK